MADVHGSGSGVAPQVEEIPERQASFNNSESSRTPKAHSPPKSNRLDEQHIFTTKTLDFLLHPNIPPPSATAKIADIGTGTGIWLLDVAKTLPPTCTLTGFDQTPSAYPPRHTWPANVTFTTHDFLQPFPASELGTYDVVAVRFVSSATSRSDWARALANLRTLLRPGGWLQWIESCNFALYCSAAGTSRAACREIYDGLEPFRAAGSGNGNGNGNGKGELVIGLMMREAGGVRREEVFREVGFVEVHEDVFSTDRLQEPELRLREKGTRNIIVCFLECLKGLVSVQGSGWTEQRIEKLGEEAMSEIDEGVYHTLDQVCIVGRKPDEI